MLISAFGEVYATAAQFPTNMPEDDWRVPRQAVTRSAPLTGGAFDFLGASRAPITTYTVRKKFMLVSPIVWTTGASTIKTIFGLNPGPDGNLYGNPSTAFLSHVAVGDYIRFTYSGTLYVYPVAEVVSDTKLRLTAGDGAGLPTISLVGSVAYEIGSADYYTNLDGAIESLKRAVLGAGESRLWLDVRDGSRRWAWAKCTRFSVLENVENQRACPIELEFYLREGVWYSENLHSETVSGAPWAKTIVNAGNVATAIKSTIHAGSAAINTLVRLGPSGSYWWDFTGTLPAGQNLIMDSARYSAKKNGVGCYNELTIYDLTIPWASAQPGSNALTVYFTGGGTGATFTIEWYDAWV